MSYKVSAADGYSLSLQQDSELLSVLQNIALLLNTKRGCSLPRKTQKTDKQNTKKSAREKTSWRI